MLIHPHTSHGGLNIAFALFMAVAVLMQLILTVPAGLHEDQHGIEAGHVLHADAHDHALPLDEPSAPDDDLVHLLSHIGHCLAHGAAVCSDDSPQSPLVRFPAPRWQSLPLRPDPLPLPLLRPPALS